MDASHMACWDTADCSRHVWNTPEGGRVISLTGTFFFFNFNNCFYFIHKCTVKHTHWRWPLLRRVSTGGVHAAFTVRRTHASLHSHDVVWSEEQTHRTSLTTSSAKCCKNTTKYKAWACSCRNIRILFFFLQVLQVCSLWTHLLS